jgi:hypothetical protein
MLNVGSPSESVQVEIDEMKIADYDGVLSFLRASPGIGRGTDSREATERYLKSGVEFRGEVYNAPCWLCSVRSR